MSDISKLKVAVSQAIGAGVTVLVLLIGAAIWASDKHQDIDNRCSSKVEKCESKVDKRLESMERQNERIEDKLDTIYKQLLGWAKR